VSSHVELLRVLIIEEGNWGTFSTPSLKNYRLGHISGE